MKRIISPFAKTWSTEELIPKLKRRSLQVGQDQEKEKAYLSEKPEIQGLDRCLANVITQ